MDKRETGRTITIKINGKKQGFEDTRQSSNRNSAESLQEKHDETSNIPLHYEEELKSQSEAAASKAELDESFDWILPESAENPAIKEFQIAAKSSTKKKNTLSSKQNGSIIKTIVTAVALAVILGTSFGLIMLKLVFTDQGSEPASLDNPPVNFGQNGNQNDGKTTAGTDNLTLPKISTFVVQGGAFSTKELAELEQKSILAKGSASRIFEENGKTLLLLSVADSKDHAKELEARYKQSGVDAYGKTIEVGGKEIAGLQTGEKEFLETLPLLFQTLAAAGANASLNTTISQSLLENIDEQAKKLAAIEDMQLVNDQIKALKASTDEAVKKINEIKDKPDPSEIMAFQQNLLAILAEYQSL